MSGWGNWNEQAGHLHFHGLFAFAYQSRMFGFKFAARRNHRPAPLSRQAQVDSESLRMTGWLDNYQQLAAVFADIVKGVRNQLGRIDAAARG